MSTKSNDADHYESLGRFVSAPGAATARLVPKLGEYIVLAPAHETKPAEVLVFQVSQNPWDSHFAKLCSSLGLLLIMR